MIDVDVKRWSDVSEGALVRGYEIERILLFDVVGYACLI